MIRQNQTYHRLADNVYAGNSRDIMAAFDCKLMLPSGCIDRFLFYPDGGNGFNGNTNDYVFSVGNAGQNSAGMVVRNRRKEFGTE